MGDSLPQPGTNGAAAHEPIMTTFVTVLYRGEDVPQHSKGIFTPEWADRLYRGVKRNTSKPFRFVCYTDDPGYIFKEPIENRPLKLPYRNMFSLLECFREDLGRVVFAGLDTVITGNIDFLMDYNGPFRMLQDPWAKRGCSGVMLFPHSPGIWSEIEANHEAWSKENTMFGFPSDMILLDKFDHEILDGPSNGIYSYKAHIKPSPALIDQANIVYFHGREKPHELSGLPWIDEHWGEPVQEPAPYIRTLNNSIDAMKANISKNSQRGLPKFNGQNFRKAIICAGGPSLEKSLGVMASGDIFAVNGVHDYLLERNITPAFHVLLDSRQENVAFVKNPKPGVRYLVSAQCHPDVFDALKGYDVTIWHTLMSRGLVDAMQVAGGNTVGLKAIYLAQLMGYRDMLLCGFDSCYEGDSDHAYYQAPEMKAKTSRIEVTVNDRKFTCDPWMVEQAKHFQKMVPTLVQTGCRVAISGNGLLAEICRQKEP